MITYLTMEGKGLTAEPIKNKLEQKGLVRRLLSTKADMKTLACVIFIILSVYYFTSIRATSLGPARLQSLTPELIIVPTSATLLISTLAKANSSSSTCSDKATDRGVHQNVISYSFYGEPDNKRDYFNGIKKNAEVIKSFYPGWVMRVYHDVPETTSATTATLTRLQQKFEDVLDLCYVGALPRYGNMLGSQQNMWRFLTLSDPLVDLTIFRDLDSTLNEREKAAVDEWLSSNYTMHLMRDHKGHKTWILAGMWGVKLNSGYRNLWNKTTGDLVRAGKVAGEKKKDQESLAGIVWPLAQRKAPFVMQHDSYYCEWVAYSSIGGMRPFPTCRNTTSAMNFVGSRRTVDLNPVLLQCPDACRAMQECTFC